MRETESIPGLDDAPTESIPWAEQSIPFADDSPPAIDPQSQGHLFYLIAQNERLQEQLAQLLVETQEHSTQVAALTHHFTGTAASAARHEQQVELITRLETIQEQLDELNKTVIKLSRSQFKSNTLTESREQQVTQSLATLQEIATRRAETGAERELAQQRRLAQMRSDARGALAADLLPSLDGLELALEHGPQILSEQRRREEAARNEYLQRQQTPPSSVWAKVRRVFGEPGPDIPPAPLPAVAGDISDALSGWLQGLELVRDRFLALLAHESIQPISALHKPFDPRLHVAVGREERADLPANTVVSVLRKGYVQGERVLRYAEVLVASAPETDSEQDEADGA